MLTKKRNKDDWGWWRLVGIENDKLAKTDFIGNFIHVTVWKTLLNFDALCNCLKQVSSSSIQFTNQMQNFANSDLVFLPP